MIKLKEVGFPTFIKKISLPLFQERDLIILYATCRPPDTIYLFELRNETIIVNIFVNVLLRILLFYISITSNIEALSYVGSKKVSENIKFIMYFSTYFYLMYINYINCGVLNFNIYSKCTQIKKISSI